MAGLKWLFIDVTDTVIGYQQQAKNLNTRIASVIRQFLQENLPQLVFQWEMKLIVLWPMYD